MQAVSNDLNEPQPAPRGTKQNLTREEREAMESLSARDDIVITKADKGGGVVIQDVDDYVAEANRQLNDTVYYKKVDKDMRSHG